jgi:hypothetical protein
MESINGIIENEIFQKTIDITTDYSEIILDDFLREGLLKEIPVVKSLVAFYNITSSISQRNKVRNILVFFNELNKKNIHTDKLLDFKLKFQEEKKFREQVLETIILLNERFLQMQKARILANFTLALIEEKITWSEFEDLSIILDTIHPKAIAYLNKVVTERKDRRISLQLKKDLVSSESLMLACGIGMSPYEGSYILTELGEAFYKYGIEPMNQL